MIIYYIAAFISCFFSFFTDSCVSYTIEGVRTKKYSLYYIFFFLSLLPFLLLTIFRYNVGTDYLVYSDKHIPLILSQPLGESLLKYEPFFILFSIISVKLLGDVSYFFVFVALVYYFFMWRALHYFSKNYALIVFLFFLSTVFFISLNAMRQMIACAMFLYSIKYIIQKKPIRYLFVIFMAFLWHRSALLYLPLYFLLQVNLRKKTMYILAGSLICADLLRKLLSTVVSLINADYIWYFLMKDNMTSYTFLISSFSMTFFFFFNYRDTKINKIFYNTSLALSVICAFANTIPGGYRLVYMFWPCTILICPIIVDNAKGYRKYFLALFFFVMIGYIFYRFQVITDSGEVNPYVSIFGR